MIEDEDNNNNVRQVLQQGVVQRAAEQGGTGGAGLRRPTAMSAARLCAWQIRLVA